MWDYSWALGLLALFATLAASVRVATICAGGSLAAIILGAFALWQAQSAIVIQGLSLLDGVWPVPVALTSLALASALFAAVRRHEGSATEERGVTSVRAQLWMLTRGRATATPLQILLTVLLVLVSVGKLFQLAQVHVLPLVVADVTTYHAPRILMWAQQGSIADFQSWEWRHNVLPKTGSAFQLQLYLVTSNLDDFEIVQWLASCVLPFAVYQLARSVAATPTQSLFAALASVGLPIVYAQSITGQNDVAVAAFTLTFIALALRALERRSAGLMFVASVALALAIGTKLVVLWAALPIGAFLALYALRNRTPIPFLARSLLMCAASILVISSYTYVENMLDGGSAFSGNLPPELMGARWSVPRLGQIGVRYLYQMIDPSGLPLFVANPLNEFRNALFAPTVPFLLSDFAHQRFGDMAFEFQPAGTFNHPVLCWYGLLGFFVLVPVCVANLFTLKSWRSGVALLASVLPLMLLVHAVFMPYHNSLGRYFMTGFLLACALLAPHLPGVESNRGALRRMALGITVYGLTVLSLFFTVVNDQRKGGFILDPHIRIVSVEDDLAIRIIAHDAIPDRQRLGLTPVFDPLLFMDPRKHHFYQFITAPEGGRPKPFGSVEELQAFAAQAQLNFIIGSRSYFAGVPAEEQHQLILCEDLFFWAANGWDDSAIPPESVLALSRLPYAILPRSLVGTGSEQVGPMP